MDCSFSDCIVAESFDEGCILMLQPTTPHPKRNQKPIYRATKTSAWEEKGDEKGEHEDCLIAKEGKRTGHGSALRPVQVFDEGCGVQTFRKECTSDGGLEPPCRVRNRQNGRLATCWPILTPSCWQTILGSRRDSNIISSTVTHAVKDGMNSRSTCLILPPNPCRCLS